MSAVVEKPATQKHRGTQNLIPWKPGQSGNPGGRPLAARTALSAAFIKALGKDFDENGTEAIVRAREEDPLGYVKVVASLLPKEVELTKKLDELDDAQLEAALIAAKALLEASRGELVKAEDLI